MDPPLPPTASLTAPLRLALRHDGAAPMTIDFLADRNALRLVVRPPLAAATGGFPTTATLDVGGGGRLLGLEISVAADPALAGPWRDNDAPATAAYDAAAAVLFMPVMPPPAGLDTAYPRTVGATVRLLTDDRGGLVAIEIPRRGHGYEIAYPSGNR